MFPGVPRGGVTITLNVTDLDDTAPVVTATQSFSYAENRTPGAVLATAEAGVPAVPPFNDTVGADV